MREFPAPNTLLDTPFGRLRIWSNDGDNLHAATKGSVNVDPEPGEPDSLATINGVQYTLHYTIETEASAKASHEEHHLRWQPRHGGWVLTYLYASRPYGGGDATDAARRKLHAQLMPLLVEWAETDEGKALRHAARVQDTEERLDKVRNEMDTKAAELTELSRKRTQLTDRLIELQHEGGA